MSHRAFQLLKAIQDRLLGNNTWRDEVHLQRTYTLNEDDELPAAIITPGEDEALSELGNVNLAFIDSLQNVSIILIAKGRTEEELLELLYDHRRQVHIALLADQSLGLPAFVIATRYQGAAELELQAEGQALVGRLATNWAVHYRMNILDPQ